jgi:hypothetical protein
MNEKNNNSTDPPLDVVSNHSNSYVWWVIGGIVLMGFGLLILGIVLWFIFRKGDSNQCDNNIYPYNATNAAGLLPILTQTEMHLTDPGSATSGSNDNPIITIDNAVGWSVVNNTLNKLQVYFYYYNTEQQEIDTLWTSDNQLLSWTSGSITNSNQDKPMFKGMTVQIYDYTNKIRSKNNYVVPNDMHPSKDVVILTYNSDGNMSGKICSI